AAAFAVGHVGADPARGLRRHTDLASPRLTGLPAVAFQIVSDRSEHVTLCRPDIAAAVAVEIFGELQITRRHELRLAHRAGPRALHLIHVDVAAVEDLERPEELV